MPDSKIIEGLREVAKAAGCDHRWQDIRKRHTDNGLTATCSECGCRVTAWPTTIHYDEIVAVLEREGER